MMYSNIPTVLADQDFYNKRSDMIAAAKGEGTKVELKLWAWDIGIDDKTVMYWIDKTVMYWIDADGKMVILK